MIKIGRSIRWYNDFYEEVKFSKLNKFDFMQVWFQKVNIIIDSLTENKGLLIKNSEFPIIFHAVFDLDDFQKYGEQLISLVNFFKHSELIIHPVCEEHTIEKETIFILANNIKDFYSKLKPFNVTLLIENNSIIDKINYLPSDLEIIFNTNPEVELLLDLVHIDSYEHLEKILEIKYPKYLHVSDKHFNVKHEHLPIGDGDLDYKYIFSNYLNNFAGNIILEIVDSDTSIIKSKIKILEAISFINN